MSDHVWGEVLDQLRRLVRLTRVTAHRHVENYEGLQPAVGGALSRLAADGETRLTALAEQQRIDVSVASRQIAELEERGLVERSPDPDDARASLLRVTPDGMALNQRIRDNQVEMMRGVLADWSEVDAGLLTDLLVRVNDDLGRHACHSPRRAVSTPAASEGRS